MYFIVQIVVTNNIIKVGVSTRLPHSYFCERKRERFYDDRGESKSRPVQNYLNGIIYSWLLLKLCLALLLTNDFLIALSLLKHLKVVFVLG